MSHAGVPQRLLANIDQAASLEIDRLLCRPDQHLQRSARKAARNRGKARGYAVTAIDGSPTLIEHAREADPGAIIGTQTQRNLPVSDASVELVTAFMSLT
jgi:hypothetical protein